MQLKRDTDHALRIVAFVDKACGQTGEKQAILLSEICAKTKVPRTAARRLCRDLVDCRILTQYTEKTGGTLYAPGTACESSTLLDVVRAVEKTDSLFAVFDHTTPLFQSKKNIFAQIDRKVKNALSEVTLREWMKEQPEG